METEGHYVLGIGDWKLRVEVRSYSSVQPSIPFARERESVTIGDGAMWLRRWLSMDEQRALIEQCRAIMNGPPGGYVPTVRGGGKMHVRMVCLGRHWNALTYQYESTRSDYDAAPVAAVPHAWAALAARIGRDAGFVFEPDLCIMNCYDAEGRMGLHQDKDEGRDSISAGLPVVSISLGDTARFLFGGLTRRDAIRPLLLESGDAFVFGGPARLRYHGVSRIFPGTAPDQLGINGRFNLTFRRY
jgi:alkylated DNA repair protein (DNA oxidative demethylase)